MNILRTIGAGVLMLLSVALILLIIPAVIYGLAFVGWSMSVLYPKAMNGDIASIFILILIVVSGLYSLGKVYKS
jgi:hypothetical protein